eukprot:gene11442-13523_t
MGRGGRFQKPLWGSPRGLQPHGFGRALKSDSESSSDDSGTCSECCQEVFDSDITCSTDGRVYGDVAYEGVNDSPSLCCAFCQRDFPTSTYTDYWLDAVWCNCYQSCSSTRCVSRGCNSHAGGNVTTQRIVLAPPLAPPSPPSAPPEPPVPPNPPPYPPAPALLLEENGTTARIDVSSHDVYASVLMREALLAPSVDTIVLLTNISVQSGSALPPVNRSLTILGECDWSGDGSSNAEERGDSSPPLLGLCEMNGNNAERLLMVDAGVALLVRHVALRFGYQYGNGGAIYVSGGGATLNLHGCLLESNRVEGQRSSGGAVYVGSESRLTFSRSQAIGNLGDYGGGIGGETGSFVHIANSSWLMENGASESGGAVLMNRATLIVEGNVSIQGNYAALGGGGIGALWSNVSIADSRLENNRADT